MENNPARRILLIEDNIDHAELIKRLFKTHAIANQIYHVTDGEEALNFLMRHGPYADKRLSPKPHLILLDLRLPKVDGLEILRRVKLNDLYNGTPIVVLTSSGALNDIRSAYDLRANSYLLKPTDYDQFEKMIDDLGFYWLDLNIQPNAIA